MTLVEKLRAMHRSSWFTREMEVRDALKEAADEIDRSMSLWVVLCGDGMDTAALSPVGGVYTTRELAEAAVAEIKRKNAAYLEAVQRYHHAEARMLARLQSECRWTGWWGDFPEHAEMRDRIMGGFEEFYSEMEIIIINSF